MGYFIPSFLQKRILRYALSRLELLDTDALDLDNLDIVWGQKCTVELREIGIRTKRLESILQLPPSLAIVSAQILFLRLTVPADLYRSGILVEIRGVDIRLNVDFENQGKRSPNRPKAQRKWRKESSRNVKADTPRHSQTHVHDPGGRRPHIVESDEDEAALENLPTTEDLARSFLENEPREEKAELEAAIVQSQYLDESVVASEAGDVEYGLGVGNAMSLPAFLSEFLNGVVDRIQVQIREVVLDTSLKIDTPSEASARVDASERLEAVLLRLTIEDVLIKNAKNVFKAHHKQGLNDSKNLRQIILSKLEAKFIYDTSLFADHAQSVGTSSPQTTFANPMERSDPRRPETSTAASETESSCIALDTTLSERAQQEFSPPSESTRLESYADRKSADILGSLSKSHHYELENNPNVQDSVVEPFFASLACRPRGEAESTRSPAGSLLNKNSEDSRHSDLASFDTDNYQATSSAFLGEQAPDALLYQLDSQSRSVESYNALDQSVHSRSDTRQTSSKPPGSSLLDTSSILPFVSTDSSPSSGDSSSNAEDLSQSKIFSHEEAESMYMSAMSHNSAVDYRHVNLPGQWNAFASDDESEVDALHAAHANDMNHEDHHGASSRGGDAGFKDEGICASSPITTLPQGARAPQDSQNTEAQRQNPGAPQPAMASSPGSESSQFNSKSSCSISKRIITIDTVKIELPLVEDAPPQVSTNSSDPNTPKQESSASSFSIRSGDTSVPKTSAFTSETSGKTDSHDFGQPISVDVGSLQILTDMGLTRMTVSIFQQVMSAIRSQDSEEVSTADLQKHHRGGRGLKLSIQKVGWQFLEMVKGSVIAQSRLGQSIQYTSEGADALLRADVRDVQVLHHSAELHSSLKLSIGKLSMGYNAEDILSFNSDLRLRDSTRDNLAPDKCDIELEMTRSKGLTKLEVTTLPLHIALDLRRLDETFSWFGGLSSMLDLGNSMMSTVTIKESNVRAPRSKRSIRGVRFESPTPGASLQTRSEQPDNKITARIGGLNFDIMGTQASLRLESSALRFVSRAEKVGLQVDRAKFTGPYVHGCRAKPTIRTKLTNIRIEYLSVPLNDDLDRLVTLLSPSQNIYERDDDILLDTLLRQRRKGGVLRVTVESLDGSLGNTNDLKRFTVIVDDLKKLSTVAKYLPEDDRPGMLTLALIRSVKFDAAINADFGAARLISQNVEMAHVTFPSLVALGIQTLQLHRDERVELITNALAQEPSKHPRLPMIMARFIGNEMEPTVKIKLHAMQVEYDIPTLMAVMGLKEGTNAELVTADIANSVATLIDRQDVKMSPLKSSSQESSKSDTFAMWKPLKIVVELRECVVGLNPHQSCSKGLVVLADTQIFGSTPKHGEFGATLELRKAEIMVIDDVAHIMQAEQVQKRSSSKSPPGQSVLLHILSDVGFVSISTVSAAKAVVRVAAYPTKVVDIEIKDDLFVLETCADSMHTLQNIVNGLSPTRPPSKELRYRTEIVPVEDMLASFSGEPLATNTNEDDVVLPLELDEGDMVDDEVPQNLEYVSSFYNPDQAALERGITDSMLEEDLDSVTGPSMPRKMGDKNQLESFEDQKEVPRGSVTLDFQDEHFGTISMVGGTAHRWNSKENTYGLRNDKGLRESPLRLRIRDVHFIWNLFDGYDWQHTRDVISNAVENVQQQATERLSRKNKRKSLDVEEEQETVIGDFLFNSIYIGIPANRDPRELARQVNQDLDELASETGTYTASSFSESPSRQGHTARPKSNRLRLRRSKRHKMTFELKGVSADIIVFPPDSGENQSSIDVRVQDFDIYDHLPTSTWRKFATYLHDRQGRESGTSMVHLEILNVKPVPNLMASEIMIKVSRLSHCSKLC